MDKINIKVEKELFKSINSNGVHKISFYMWSGKFVTYEKYLNLCNSSEKFKVKEIHHMCHKTNVGNHVLFNLFTSKNKSYIPIGEDKIGVFENIEINNKKKENMFLFTNKLLLLKQEEFCKYFKISDEFNSFPRYVQSFSKNEIVKHALKATEICYKNALKDGIILIEKEHNNIIYSKIDINETFEITSNGVINLYSKPHIFTENELEILNNKMYNINKNGFTEEYGIRCEEIIVGDIWQ